MTTNGLAERLDEAIGALRANPRIEVVEIGRREISNESLDKLEVEMGAPLPDELRALYLESGKGGVMWRSWAQPDIWGKLSLQFSFFDGSLRVAKDLYYLPDKGCFSVSVKMAKPDTTSARKSTRKLTESFEEAFDIMLRARGAQGWAQAYFGRWTGDNREATRHNPRAGLFQAAIPDLFDDFESEDFGKAAEIPPVTDLGSLDQIAFDLSAEKAGLSFAKRLRRQIQIVSQNPAWKYFDVQINPPVTQEEIDSVHATMGFELSEAFLNYFRSCNGFRYSAVEVPSSRAEEDFSDQELREIWTKYRETGGGHASVDVRPLREVFTAKAMPPMDGRESTRFFAYLDNPLPGGHALKTWHMLAADLELGTTDPILRMTTDYGADLDSRAPVEACSYFEWLLKVDGAHYDHEALFKAFGYSVSGPVYEATREELSQLSHRDHFGKQTFTKKPSIYLYRLDDLPAELTADIPSDAGLRNCLFWVTKEKRAVAGLFSEIPEASCDHVEKGLRVAQLVGQVALSSDRFAHRIRTRGGSGTRYESTNIATNPWPSPKSLNLGFHTGDADEVEAWLLNRGVHVLPIGDVLKDLIFLQVDDANAALEARLETVSTVKRTSVESIAPGIFCLDAGVVEQERLKLVVGDREIQLAADELESGVVTRVRIE